MLYHILAFSSWKQIKLFLQKGDYPSRCFDTSNQRLQTNIYWGSTKSGRMFLCFFCLYFATLYIWSMYHHVSVLTCTGIDVKTVHDHVGSHTVADLFVPPGVCVSGIDSQHRLVSVCLFWQWNLRQQQDVKVFLKFAIWLV